MAYFLKINIAIALFYAFYRLFFYKDTFFVWRRTALLCFFAVSVLYPLLNFETWITQQEPIAAMAGVYAEIVMPELSIPLQGTTDWKGLLYQYIGYLYWGGVTLLTLRMCVQLARIVHLAMRCPKTQINETTVSLLPVAQTPFSFFHWIFVHPAMHTPEELNEILTHEQTHADQWHSIDVLIGELGSIFCWFNPFVWLMKREIRTNLEYMADERVLRTGHDSRTYQYHLLGLANQKAAATIYNNFNVLPLKKRIKMMNKKRTKEVGRTKYLLFLPLAALLMLISNIETVARTTGKIAAEAIEAVELKFEQPTPQPVTPPVVQPAEQPVAPPAEQPAQDKGMIAYKGKVVDKDGKAIEGVIVAFDEKEKIANVKSGPDGNFQVKGPAGKMVFLWEKENGSICKVVNATQLTASEAGNMMVIMDGPFLPKEPVDPNNPIFEVVEQMPEFPGGIEGLMEYMRNNIKYPEAAKLKGTQGRVVVQFIVEKDGTVSNISNLRAVDSHLDGEAIRVISTMPNWKPGMQGGKPVRVRYTVPVKFSLPAKTDDTTQGKADKAPEATTIPQFTPEEVK